MNQAHRALQGYFIDLGMNSPKSPTSCPFSSKPSSLKKKNAFLNTGWTRSLFKAPVQFGTTHRPINNQGLWHSLSIVVFRWESSSRGLQICIWKWIISLPVHHYFSGTLLINQLNRQPVPKSSLCGDGTWSGTSFALDTPFPIPTSSIQSQGQPDTNT